MSLIMPYYCFPFIAQRLPYLLNQWKKITTIYVASFGFKTEKYQKDSLLSLMSYLFFVKYILSYNLTELHILGLHFPKFLRNCMSWKGYFNYFVYVLDSSSEGGKTQTETYPKIHTAIERLRPGTDAEGN